MDRKIKRYGWSRDLPDGRDMMYAAPMEVLERLPAKVDLRKQCPAVYDQGQLGSCTANAIGAALEFGQMKQRQAAPFTPSRLFIYYNERRHRGHDRLGLRRDDPRRHQVGRQAGRPTGDRLAVRHRQVPRQAVEAGLRRGARSTRRSATSG